MILGIPIENSCKFIDITPVNPFISKCNIKVCYVQDSPNRKGSIITREVAEEMAKSLPGSPIVGFYNREKGDFEGHNAIVNISGDSYEVLDGTRPYGFVDLNAKVWFQDYREDDVIRTYLMTEGYMWTGQYPETERVLSLGNNQSMEIDVIDQSSVCNGDGCYMIINEALIKKLCILGQNVEPCFEGASIVQAKFSADDIKTLVENFTEKFSAFTEELQKTIIKEGGTSDMSEKVTTIEYNLVDVVEYQDLLVTHNELQTEFETMKNNFEAATTELVEANEKLVETNEKLEFANNELTGLKEFKAEIEKREKFEMINSFSMLADEDKEDVKTNVDLYSLEEIESKLAVICVRKKVNFNLGDEKEVSPAEEPKQDDKQTFSLNMDSFDNEGETIPAWMKAVKKYQQVNK